MRPVDQGAEAEERDLKYLNRALERANKNTERPRAKHIELVRSLATAIDILTGEKVARARTGSLRKTA